MRRTIAVFLAALAFLAAEFVTNGQQAFAGKCEYEYMAPVGVSILTEKEVLARVADHTVVGSYFQYYFGQDGTLTYYTNHETFPGNWYSCGPVVVFEYFNDEHNTERLFAIRREGKISFYNLRGRHQATLPLKKGKLF